MCAKLPEFESLQGCTYVMGVCSVGSLLPTIPVGSFVVPDDWYCPFDIRRVNEGMEAHFLPVLDEDLREVILNGCSDVGVPTVVSRSVSSWLCVQER